jgi:phage terminase large subunit-like protein
LQHSKGEWAGKPFELSDWQVFILWVLFGWKRADGWRRFRTAFVFVPRKNGKSTLMAGIGLYLTVMDGEEGAEVYTAATKLDQAKLSWEEAVRMRSASPALREITQYWKSSNTIDMEATYSKFKPLGADSDTMDGLNVHGALIDELHAHKTSDVVDVLQTATGSRRQPLQFEITTAGFDQEGIGHQHYEYGKAVLDRIFDDDSWFVYIAEIDQEDDWREPTTWAKANPNLGVSVKVDDLERKALEAKNRPAALNNFLCKHLNKWVQQETRWIPIEAWNAGEIEVEWEELRGQPCYAGMDLSSRVDVSSLALVFPREGGKWLVLTWHWIPEENMREREQRDRVPYGLWCAEGWVEATPGNVIDYERIKAKIGELASTYDILELGYDPWSATQIAIQLQEQGLPMVEISQRYSTLSEPSKAFEAAILGGTLEHDNSPVMRWMVDCVSVVTDSNDNIRPSKPDRRKSSKRIDGVAATVNALFCLLRHQNKPSSYDDGGLFT